jgi:SAM-dependent methyltransferase
LDCIEKKNNIGQLLDVGCGCGFFLKEAESRGWNVTGVDPSRESIHYCKKLLNNGVIYQGTLNNMPKGKKYDVITMINVLDHSTEPWSEIERSRILLKPGGFLFIRLPNGIFHTAAYIISKSFKLENFVRDFLVFHEYSMTPRFIRRLLGDYGLSNIVIRNASFSGGTFFIRLLKKSFGVIVSILFIISGGKCTIGPSLEITAQNI